MEERSSRANTIIRNHVLFAVGGGLIPIPLMDIAAVTAIQIDMLQQLCTLYEIPYSRSAGKLRLSAIAGGALARAGATLIKAIPGVGTVIGTLSMSALSGASTYAMGNVFVKHFELGGDLYDFDPEAYREDYEAKMEEGKAKTEEWQESCEAGTSEAGTSEAGTSENGNSAEDPQFTKLTKLKELNELKEAGAITEEEFAEFKRKLLDEFLERNIPHSFPFRT